MKYAIPSLTRAGSRLRFHIWFVNNGEMGGRRSSVIAGAVRATTVNHGNAIYRIVQEALTNACKHSKSKKVTVTHD